VIVDITNPQGVDRAESSYRIDTQNRNHNNLIFQEASAYGHLFSGQIYCPSDTDAIVPVFSSELDSFSWRWGGLDSLTFEAVIPGLREIGNWPANTWGAVYPRTGWTIQHSEPKSSAITTQRVGDIITRENEPHIYITILDDRYVYEEDEMMGWPPKELEENTNEHGWWQITQLESNSQGSGGFSLDLQCLIFGENDTASTTGWGGGKVQEDGEYRYTLWRPYTCCEVDVGIFVKIPFGPYSSPATTN
jgi:integrating conjugative element protein (TIGR03756 family)